MGFSYKAMLNKFVYVPGAAQSIWDDVDEVDTYIPEMDNAIETRVPEFANFETEPEYDEQNPLVKLLKRASVFLPDGYRRSSRPNRLIIPFYSYGYDLGNYRSRPRAPFWHQSAGYDQNPWNIGSGKLADRYRSRRYSVYK